MIKLEDNDQFLLILEKAYKEDDGILSCSASWKSGVNSRFLNIYI